MLESKQTAIDSDNASTLELKIKLIIGPSDDCI